MGPGGSTSLPSLLVLTPEVVRKRFQVDVRVNTEAVCIDRENKEIIAKDISSGSESHIPYDTLLLSPGAEPVRLPLPGSDDPRVRTLRNIGDMDEIIRLLDAAQSSRSLVIGGGYTGQRFAAAARARGAQVWLTSRSAQEEPHWLRFNAGEGAIPELPEALSHVLITLPPNGDGEDDAYNLLRASLEQQPLDWVGYLSTTGVYGDTQGQWADEGSPTQPGLRRSQSRLQCEQHWLASALPLQSFRLPAIYGPGRCPFQQLEQGTARLIHKPKQVFCRIHVDDIVG